MRHLGDAELNAGHCCQFALGDGTRINVLEDYYDLDEQGRTSICIEATRRLTNQEQLAAVQAHRAHLTIRTDQPYRKLPVYYKDWAAPQSRPHWNRNP